MPAEFARYAFYFAFRGREHLLVVERGIHFIRRPRLRQKLLQLLQVIGPNGATLAAKHHESHRPIQLGYLGRRQ